MPLLLAIGFVVATQVGFESLASFRAAAHGSISIGRRVIVVVVIIFFNVGEDFIIVQIGRVGGVGDKLALSIGSIVIVGDDVGLVDNRGEKGAGLISNILGGRRSGIWLLGYLCNSTKEIQTPKEENKKLQHEVVRHGYSFLVDEREWKEVRMESAILGLFDILNEDEN